MILDRVSRLRTLEPSPPLLIGIAVAAAVAAALLWPLADSAAFGPGWGQVLEIGIGVAFVACGLMAWARWPELPAGLLLVLTGLTWWAHLLEVTRHPILFSVGSFLSLSFLPALTAAVLGFPRRRLRAAWDRFLVVGAAAAWLIGGPGGMPFYEPRDFGCSDCEPGLNLLLVDADPARLEQVHGISKVLITALLVAIVATLAVRLLRATPPARRIAAPLYVPAGIWAVAYGLYLHFPRLNNTVFNPGDRVDRILLFTFGCALATIPVTILLGMRRSRGRHLRVSHLVRELGQERSLGALEEALRRTLGDPSLALGVRAEGWRGYLRANGEELKLPADGDPDRTATALGGESGDVAMLVHDRALLIDDRELVEAVGAAAQLAVENHQLQGELRRSLEEVRASRARLVQAGDVERHRIERNLHDGAQQRLVSLGLALQLAEMQLGDGADPALRASLTEMREQMSLAVDELRELALGLHPAILTEQGLAAALEGLARRSSVPVTLVRVPDERLPETIETTAYYLVSEALTNAAKHAHATRVEIRAAVSGGELHVEVRDNGIGGAKAGASSGLPGIIDRVEAVDGRLEIESPPGSGTTLRAAIPCTAEAAVPDTAR